MDIWGKLSNIVASVMAAFVGIASSVMPSATTPQTTPTPTPNTVIQENMVIRSGEISYSGQSVKYSINIPKNGGDITGSISGVCTGDITGTYDGAEGGRVSGEANPSCGIAFLRQTFNVKYDGQVYLKQGRADLNWEGNIPSTSGKGSYTFSFEPEK